MTPTVQDFAHLGSEVDTIPVHINYDIIRLFSEGLYRSPHKAIEELATNSYDAGAKNVHVLLPGDHDNGTVESPLWVIDDGSGMDKQGFHALWHIADSNKPSTPLLNNRAPIGQFGIGKLAAYVLAWKLTHVSYCNDQILLTTMDFKQVTGRQTAATPVPISLRRINEQIAKQHLASIKHTSPPAWRLMFGGPDDRAESWTAARLFDFRDLYDKLQRGTLRWVLSTGLPLQANFRIWLNSDKIESSKEKLREIHSTLLNCDIPDIGSVRGKARIFERTLAIGKSQHVHRSNGFFVRVRGRVINLDDPLFGVSQPNHAAWTRFSMEVQADGLHDHLLSSREGVRDSRAVQQLRELLLDKFNECRSEFDEWTRKQNTDIDIGARLSSPSRHVTEPLLRSVRNTVHTGQESFYVNTVRGLDPASRSTWLAKYEVAVSSKPIDKTDFRKAGPYAPAISYDPEYRGLSVNSEHPFVDKLSTGGKKPIPAKLFAFSELFLEGQLQEHGLDSPSVAEFLRNRDHVLRLVAGQAPLTASEILRRLEIANQDQMALEEATGMAFRVLGFEYEKRGGYRPGPDGILYARLGRHDRPKDYKLVYDTKQTASRAVSADKINIVALDRFRKDEDAAYGFFVAERYEAEATDNGSLNRRAQPFKKISFLKISHLKTLVWMHYQYGLTLTEVGDLFATARLTSDVDCWLEKLKTRMEEAPAVPVETILRALEEQKSDLRAVPNILVVRAKNSELKKFDEERVIARMAAIEAIIGKRWMEVDRESGRVKLHSTAKQILEALDRNMEPIDLDTEKEGG